MIETETASRPPAVRDQPSFASVTMARRIGALDWPSLSRDLSERGYAESVSAVLTPDECRALIAMYGEPDRFRARIDMARHRFGRGEYQYFASPLPDLVRALREAAYPLLALIANQWNDALGVEDRYPDTLDALLAHCADK